MSESVDRTPALRRGLVQLPLWIGLGVLLNLALVHFVSGREGLAALRTVGVVPASVVLGLAFVPWLLNAMRIRIWTDALGQALSFRAALRVVVSTEILAAATPTAVGGAPAKATLVYREGLSPGATLALTALGSAEDALFFVLAVPLAIWLSPSLGVRELAAYLSDAIYALSGEATQSQLLPALLIGVVGLGLVWTVWRRFGTPLSKAIRNHRKKIERQWNAAGSILWKERRRLLLTLPLTTLQWTSRYAIVSVVAWGLGLPVDVFLLFVLQCLVFSILVLIPTPGGSGGAEGVFLLFHQGIAGADVAVLLLAWRTLTFFLPVAVGAVGLILAFRAGKQTRPRSLSSQPEPDRLEV